MILPELPSYLDSLGGAAYKGAIIGLFTVSACVSRPFSGRLADTIGRVPIIIIGTLLAIVTNTLYIAVPTVSGFLLLRLIHGFTIGFSVTGSTAYLSDIVPNERRGEAMGFLGLMNNVGAGLSPLLGSYVTKNLGINYLFILASLFASSAALVFWNLKETLVDKERFEPNHLKLKKQDLAERRVWLPALIMFFMVFSYGTILTIGFDLAEHLKAQNKGVILMIMTLSSVLVRVIAGRFSDRYGRKTAVIIGLLLLIGGILLMAQAKSLGSLYLASFIVGLANGMNNPTIFAWVTDWSNPANKGRAISTVFIMLEAGIGIGSFVSAAVYANNIHNIASAFYLSAGFAFVGIVLLFATWKYHPKLIFN